MEVLEIKSAATAFLISILLTPLIVKFSKRKGFIAAVNHRSSHEELVPNTGGIILCFAIVISLLLYTDYAQQEDFSMLLSAFAVLLITGIIDDFNPIPVVFKFLGQFIPAIVIVASMDESELVTPFLHDLVALPHIFNYLFWIFFIVLCINAFNLIDGIDGLAISLGIVSGGFYWFQFREFGNSNLMIFAISLVFGLLGLLYFNFSSKNKIFIGDTGSLLIGGLLVFFSLKYINFAGLDNTNKSFFMVVGTVFVPLADMIRVSLVRVFNGDSPFKADRRHIHHIVLDYCRNNHLLTTAIIVVAQILSIYLFYLIHKSDSTIFFGALILAFLIYFMIVYFLDLRLKRKINTVSSYD